MSARIQALQNREKLDEQLHNIQNQVKGGTCEPVFSFKVKNDEKKNLEEIG